MAIEEEVKGKDLDKKIFVALIEKLKKRDAWERYGDDSIHHKSENICLTYDLNLFQITHTLTQPEKIKCPRKFNKQIQKLVRNIVGFNTNEKKIFCLDVMNGKYPGYIDTQMIPKEEFSDFEDWLTNEVRPENYVKKPQTVQGSTIYFKRKADHAFLVLKWL